MDLGGHQAAVVVKSESRPIPFTIDLNETPSPSSENTPSSSTVASTLPVIDAYSLACNFHGNPSQSDGCPAEFPGEAGLGAPLLCGVCERVETRGNTLVCDGCEVGFHLGCVGMKLRPGVQVGEWVCDGCAQSGVRSKRWPLGTVCAGPRKGGRGVSLLDINALPPSDGDADVAVEEFQHFTNGKRKPTFSHNNATSYDGQSICSETAYVTNGLDSGFGSITTTKRARRVDDTSHKGNRAIWRHEDATLRSSLEGMFTGTAIPLRTSARLQQDMLLQSLREFVAERQGHLSDGWHVEFTHTCNHCALCAVYCSPDGKRFDTMLDVARYLGLTSNVAYGNTDEKIDTVGVIKKSCTLRRSRKELARLSRTNNSVENQVTKQTGFVVELDNSEGVSDKLCSSSMTVANKESITEGEGCEFSHLNIGLPIQFEDFVITYLGKIDNRPAYHNCSQIWPLGFKSSWHDKITGSLFECEVSDGGASGPIFRVTRRSCSALAVPLGETILLPVINSKSGIQKMPENDAFVFEAGCEEDDQIWSLLSDPSESGKEPSFLSVLSDKGCKEAHINVDCQRQDSLTSHCEGTPGLDGGSNQNHSIKDKIGDFYVEGRSSSSVWRMVSQTFVKTCKVVYKQTHTLQFDCGHRDIRSFPLQSQFMDTKYIDHLGLLARFYYAAGPVDAPHTVKSDADLEVVCDLVSKWLDQDRFGLDMEFSQEVIEQLPGAETCLQYNFLRNRRNYLTSHTVASGFLLPKHRNIACGKGDIISYASYMGYKSSPMSGQHEEQLLRNNFPPPGQVFQGRLPSELFGDVLQIWELFWRFYEILGLNEPLTLEEIEAELIDPWTCNSSVPRENLKEIHDKSTNLLTVESSRAQPYISHETDREFSEEYTFIPVEMKSMDEASQFKLASYTFERCAGLALTKAHMSLLKVLIGELQNKVVDPNSDAVEMKPRRGRRKEVECAPTVKKYKLDMLPINELTWPELARRYVLTVSAMSCTPDSAEISSREGTKIFRCLQGDGGILCGSLAGVAGMEADAQLLAEAERRISHPVQHEYEVIPVEHIKSEATNATEPVTDTNSDVLPEWAELLVPVKKLPTNVGTRIRKCIYESLDKDPPEWAKKILMHSISKEVYKGNASGPTKKAVLNVLARVAGSGETLHQKTTKQKSVKCVDSLSNVIMKKCRIVLRRAVSADEDKVFCNLLGTVLLCLNDNDDDGILGFPGMVSRPLDFRTVDLRLKFGAYGGSHEAFVEDVREVWHNIRIAYRERPDLMELVEALSQKFESLYEKEVLSLVKVFTGETRGDSVCSETQKKLDNHCADEVPKAPWEDGVCKVCGIDKDDDSVLLCDSCDSEYHTYCLVPPLLKIPAGNWYCPSCLARKNETHDSSHRTQMINQKQRRHVGDEILNPKESLTQLANSLEERDYWDLNVEERTFLLKFLCDEVLNSVLLREHIDHCADMSMDLQQKLQSLVVDWKNLKSKEAMLMMTVAKENTNKLNGNSDTVGEVLAHVFGNCGSSDVNQQNLSSFSKNDTGCVGTLELKPSANTQSNLENKVLDIDQQLDQKNLKCEALQCVDVVTSQFCNSYGLLSPRGQAGHDSSNSQIHENEISRSCVDKKNEPSKPNMQSCTVPQAQKSDEMDNSTDEDNMQNSLSCTRSSLVSCLMKNNAINLEKDDAATLDKNLSDDSRHLQDTGVIQMDDNASPSSMPERSVLVKSDVPSVDLNTEFLQNNCNISDVTVLKSCTKELISLKNDISHLQGKITALESQIVTTSLRGDFLGRDSFGRIFWAIGKPGRRPWLLVNGSMEFQDKSNENHNTDIPSIGGLNSQISFCTDEWYYPRILDSASHAGSDPVIEGWFSSPWILYDSDAEIQELVNWLRHSDPRERELKENILQWQRIRSYHVLNPLADGANASLNSAAVKKDPVNLLTKASSLLKQRYGPCLELEGSDIPRKRGKQSKTHVELKMYRCECFEPVWPSRDHCLSCHQTFETNAEFKSHNEGKCLTSSGIDESKENGTSKGKGKQCFNVAGVVDAPVDRNTHDVNSRFVNIQKKTCPYDIEYISHKFKTKVSNKELVREIGLIGSNGIPSFIQETPYNMIDPPLVLNPVQKHSVHHNIGASFGERLTLPTEEARLALSVDHIDGGQHPSKPRQKCADNGSNIELPVTSMETSHGADNGELISSQKRTEPEPGGNFSCTIPESSLKPLCGKVGEILKRLKIDLLDMEAALPNEALKQTRASSTKRCAWRAFVKSADMIYEMVQATILLEGMIKTEYLRNRWWYWSSLTAAAKTPTLSSLALRIYSLDASIMYSKASQCDLEMAENPKVPNKSGRKRKDMDGGS